MYPPPTAPPRLCYTPVLIFFNFFYFFFPPRPGTRSPPPAWPPPSGWWPPAVPPGVTCPPSAGARPPAATCCTWVTPTSGPSPPSKSAGIERVLLGRTCLSVCGRLSCVGIPYGWGSRCYPLSYPQGTGFGCKVGGGSPTPLALSASASRCRIPARGCAPSPPKRFGPWVLISGFGGGSPQKMGGRGGSWEAGARLQGKEEGSELVWRRQIKRSACSGGGGCALCSAEILWCLV